MVRSTPVKTSMVTDQPLLDKPRPLCILLQKVVPFNKSSCSKWPSMLHIITSCSQTKLEGGLQRLVAGDDTAFQWLMARTHQGRSRTSFILMQFGKLFAGNCSVVLCLFLTLCVYVFCYFVHINKWMNELQLANTGQHTDGKWLSTTVSKITLCLRFSYISCRIWFRCLHRTHKLLQQESITKSTRMWANAQCDGRLPNIGGALCSTPQFGWRPLLECRAVMLPRSETSWNLQGCPKLTKRSQPLVGRSSPYCEDM